MNNQRINQRFATQALVKTEKTSKKQGEPTGQVSFKFTKNVIKEM
jgi:hypothetical protein